MSSCIERDFQKISVQILHISNLCDVTKSPHLLKQGRIIARTKLGIYGKA